jgi:PPM family protein phosphatase
MGSDAAAATAAELVVASYAALSTDADNDVVTSLLTLPNSIVADMAAKQLTAGSTAAVALLDSDGRLWLSTIGDSRIIVVRGLELLHASPIDNDAALASTLGLAVTDPLAEHRLSRYLAAGTANCTPTVSVFEAQLADVIVVMTDGVERSITPFGITALVAGAQGPGSLVAAILSEAERIGFSDNATCVVAHVADVETGDERE